MTWHEAVAVILVAFFVFVSFALWIIARPSSPNERERSNYSWRIESAPARKPKPVNSPQPNRRKKKKSHCRK